VAYEDFTDGWTEVDEDSDITRATNSITVDTIRRDADSGVYKDYGTDHFDDFTHYVDVKVTAAGETSRGNCAFWGLSDTPNYTLGDMGVNNEGLAAYAYNTGANARIIKFTDYSNDNNDYYGPFTVGDWYYIRIVRSSTQVVVTIYSDSSHETIVDTLYITTTTDAKDYMVIIANREGDTFVDNTISLLVDNLDLQEAPPPTGKKIPNYFNADYVPCDA